LLLQVQVLQCLQQALGILGLLGTLDFPGLLGNQVPQAVPCHQGYQGTPWLLQDLGCPESPRNRVDLVDLGPQVLLEVQEIQWLLRDQILLQVLQVLLGVLETLGHLQVLVDLHRVRLQLLGVLGIQVDQEGQEFQVVILVFLVGILMFGTLHSKSQRLGSLNLLHFGCCSTYFRNTEHTA